MRYILVSFFVFFLSFNAQAKIQDILDVMCDICGNSLGWRIEVAKDDHLIENTLDVYRREIASTIHEIGGNDLTDEQILQMGMNQSIILKDKIKKGTGCLLAFRDIQTQDVIGSLFLDEVITKDKQLVWDLRAFGLYKEYKKDPDSIKKGLFPAIKGAAITMFVDKIASSGKNDEEFMINKLLLDLGFERDDEYFTLDRPAGLVKYFSMKLKD
ncbi:MAG: hypothetical protein Q8K60_05400 [Parachlamydiaceae bacterium]|nr:hypothetical protein [Parachlamydiaceae bacterium]